MRTSCYFFTCAVAFFSLNSQAELLSLKDAFESASQKNELPRIQNQRVEEAHERTRQARGAFMPTIAALGSYSRQDQENINGKTSRNFRINAQQPVFRGLRQYASYDAVTASERAEHERVRQTQLSLYAQVAQSYYELLAAEADLDSLRTLARLTEKRRSEMQSRSENGRARIGDLLSTQAQGASVDAQIEAGQSRLEQAWTNFMRITGLETKKDIPDINEAPPMPAELETYLNKIQQRPDIAAQQATYEASEAAVKIARGGHFPSLDLSGNYYLERKGGVLAQSKWDVGAQLSIPLFQGGVVKAQVGEAAARSAEQRIELERLRRNAETEIRNIYSTSSSAVRQYTALERALEISKRNFDTQVKDYRLGLATSLDALQALNNYQDLQRSLERVRYQALTSLAMLNVASGEIK